MKRRYWASLALLLLISCSSIDQEILQVDFYNLARDFQSLGYLERAEYYYNLALESPDPPLEAYYNLTLLYIQKGDFSKGESSLKTLEEQDPQSRELLRMRIYLEKQRENYIGVEELAEQVLELYPADPYALEELARIEVEREQWQTAEDYLKEILETDVSEDIFSLRFRILEKLDDPGALKDFLNPYKKEEWFPLHAAEGLLDLYFEEEDSSSAFEWIEYLIERNPDSEGRYLYRKAEWMLVEQSLWEEGMQELKSALRAGYRDESALKDLSSSLDSKVAEEVTALKELFLSE